MSGLLRLLKAGCLPFSHLENGVRHWSDASTAQRLLSGRGEGVALSSLAPVLPKTAERAQLVFAPLSLLFFWIRYISHANSGACGGGVQLFFLCLFAICVFKGTGRLLA